ncbi:MAG: hypothetical protein KDJ31_15040 [Candidatus Competibacteraceae bacterium]|nr:hypothetical protein [Candidatus Competibacteraceae bacterium]MCB1822402.1 hypothetical protein [Candidatus Competibacteraceae bacterium]
MLIFALNPAVNAKHPALGVITHMTGVNNHHILPMLGVGCMTISSDNTADLTVIEGKHPKVFADENNWIALILIGTKCS